VLYRDGVPVATLVAGEFAYLEAVDGPTRELMRLRLAQRT